MAVYENMKYWESNSKDFDWNVSDSNVSDSNEFDSEFFAKKTLPLEVMVPNKFDPMDGLMSEIQLTHSYGLTAYSSFFKDINCDICFDSLLGQYALQYPCDFNHIYHRNCLLTNVLIYGRKSCPSCTEIPEIIYSL